MKREIKFRGKILHGVLQGQWIYGYYAKHNEQVFIFPIFEEPGQYEHDSYEVDPETVGQFTGLKDKNGKEIYEGDILRWWIDRIMSKEKWEGILCFNRAMWRIKPTVKPIKSGKGVLWENLYDCTIYANRALEVIGNIYENHESLVK